MREKTADGRKRPSLRRNITMDVPSAHSAKLRRAFGACARGGGAAPTPSLRPRHYKKRRCSFRFALLRSTCAPSSFFVLFPCLAWRCSGTPCSPLPLAEWATYSHSVSQPTFIGLADVPTFHRIGIMPYLYKTIVIDEVFQSHMAQADCRLETL